MTTMAAKKKTAAKRTVAKKAKHVRRTKKRPQATPRRKRGGLTHAGLEARWLKPPHDDPRTLDAMLRTAAHRAGWLNSRARGEDPRVRALAAILHVVAHGTPADLAEVESAAAKRLRDGAGPRADFASPEAERRMADRISRALARGVSLDDIVLEEMTKLMLAGDAPDELYAAIGAAVPAPVKSVVNRDPLRASTILSALGEKKRKDATAIARAIRRVCGVSSKRVSRAATQREYRGRQPKTGKA